MKRMIELPNGKEIKLEDSGITIGDEFIDWEIWDSLKEFIEENKKHYGEATDEPV